jgi:hypothetical protein
MYTTDQITRATVAVAFALALSVGAATAPAQAAPNLSITNHLTIDPVAGTNAGVYHTDTQGVVTMSQAAAQDSINHGYTVQLRYWGDDEFTDDLIYGPIAAPNMFAAADGLHYQYNVNLSGSQLNEDDVSVVDALADDGQDEIYVGARFLDPSGKTVSQVESNRVNKNF